MKNNPPSKISHQQSLRVLIVEDSEDDVLLTIRELKKGGYNPVYERVETAAAMKKALRDKQWNIILCDYKMPKFNAPSAIALLKESNVNIPLIILSGAIGEDVAVECMRLGAHDYIMKTNLSRLCPAIARELEEAEFRNKQKQAESQRDAAIEALRKSEKYFKEITENSSDILIITDENGNIKYCSRSIERFTGYKPEEIIGKSAFNFIHPDELQRAADEYSKAIQTNDSTLIHDGFRVLHKNGSEVYLDGMGRNLLDNSDVRGFVMNVRDITDRKRAEEKLIEEQQRFKALAEQSSEVIVLVNREGIVMYENPAIEKALGYTPEERMGISAFSLVHPDDLDVVSGSFKALFNEKDASVQKAELRLRHKDGNWHTFDVAASNLVHDNKIENAIVNLHDITDRKKALDDLHESRQRYRELSIMDDLTHLYNSRHFYNELKREIERSNRYVQPLTLLLIDLDKFKDYNDTYGHLEGDNVLSQFGKLIRRCLRENDSAYRYGGEEFTILLPMTTYDDGLILAQRIQTELGKENFSPFLEHKVYLTVSIGLSQYKPQEDIKTFIRRVDQLMYKVKKTERGKICSDNAYLQ